MTPSLPFKKGKPSTLEIVDKMDLLVEELKVILDTLRKEIDEDAEDTGEPKAKD